MVTGAKVYDEKGGVQVGLDTVEISPYIRFSMRVVAAIGLGPDTPLWKACLATALYVSFQALSVVAFSAVQKLQWRVAMAFYVWSFCMLIDFIGMIVFARGLKECSPWYIETQAQADLLKECFGPLLVAVGIQTTVLFVAHVSFAANEIERQGVLEPDHVTAGFYVLCFFASYGPIVMHMVYDALTFEYLGLRLAMEQKDFTARIKSRSLSFPEALREHKMLNQNHRRVIDYVTIEGNVACTLFNLGSIFLLYEYFVTAHSHWFHITFYCLNAIGMCIVFPLHWSPVNDNQIALQVLVAEAVDNERATKDKIEGSSDLENLSGQEHTELWNAAERSQFLIYLQTTQTTVCVFQWPIGVPYIMEVILLYVTQAFLMWQVATLSGFKGFSFDVGSEL